MRNNIPSKTALVLVFSLIFAYSSNAQIPVPSGKLDEAASQLVFWYDNGCNDDLPFDSCDQDRQAAIQVTNTNSSEGVWVHVQVYRSFQAAAGPPRIITRCAELNFVDFYTPRDTHTYVMNQMCFNNSGASCNTALSVPRTKGFVLLTPIRAESDNRPIAWQHMIGSTYVADSENDSAFRVNAMGRDAVNFSNNSVVADGTELDGTTTGFVVIQPTELFFNTASGSGNADVVLISFIDQYNDDETLGYRAVAGETNISPFIHDSVETRISCTPFINTCFNNFGLIDPNLAGDDVPQLNDNIDPGTPICDGVSVVNDPILTDSLVSWTRLPISGYDQLENQFGVIVYHDEAPGDSVGGADWMNSESK